MSPITGSSPGVGPSQEQYEAMVEQANRQMAVIKETFGRVPIQVPQLLKEINDAGWPSDVLVHPVDFFFLIGSGISVHKDNAGPYFYLSATKVRPVPGTQDTLDLSDWAPPTIKLATFLGD